MWAFACGAIAAGATWSTHGLALIAGVFLAGPMVCATSQAVNDWFDREVDAINEPHRPIPSGRMPGSWGLRTAIVWTLLSLAVGALLGPMVFSATCWAILLAWLYSAPPIRLKQNGWLGNLACGICYEGLAWMTGAAIGFHGIDGNSGSWTDLFFSLSGALALLYSLSAHGIMTLNDFKSITGDRKLGINSLPAMYGSRSAAWLSALFMLLPQIGVVVLMLVAQKDLAALSIGILMVVQILMLRVFIANPVGKALWYSAAGVPVLVSGMMICAWAIRPIV